MCTEFVGSVVSIDCGDVLGTYQGIVTEVNPEVQSVTITRAFRNGVQCQVPSVTIKACDIHELKIIKTQIEAGQHTQSPLHPRIAVSKSDALVKCDKAPVNRKSPFNTKTQMKPGGTDTSNGYYTPQKLRFADNGYTNNNTRNRKSPPKAEETFRKRTNSASESSGRGSRKGTNAQKIESRRRPQREDCFSAPLDSFLDEFDFEKNLALFDKQAVFEEIENSGHPHIVRPSDRADKTRKLRNDENILSAEPVKYRQIRVPENDRSTEYFTDSGLVVPSVDCDVRSKLLSLAMKYGLSIERQIEMVGRSATEMVLQLLGGGHRLTPKNAHQRPSVVVLCGPHVQGAQGLNCARHLAGHNVRVTAFVPNFAGVTPALEQENQLFDLTDGKKTYSAKDLPHGPVDIIINAMDSHDQKFLRSELWYQPLVEWANQNKASVLAIDPPPEGGPINIKWSLGMCLPLRLSEKCGQSYLCDLSIPKKIFQELGIIYQSPFAHKFVIPLHSNS